MTTKTILILISLIGLAHMVDSDAKTTPKNDVSIQTPKFYVGLLEPKVRKQTNFSEKVNTPGKICGGTPRESIHYITSYEFQNKFSWFIETPISGAKCRFRISDAADQNDDPAYVNLYPLTGSYDSKDGSFPCENAGYNSNYFQIPEEISCDKCILEWFWVVPDYKIEVRQCSDLTVVAGQDQNCLGQCQNGGVCRKGTCICKEGYSGDHCENSSSITSIWSTLKSILLVLFLIAILVALGYFGYMYLKKKSQAVEADNVNASLMQSAAPVRAPVAVVQERREFEEPPPRPMNDFDYLQANMAGRLRRDSDRESFRPSGV